MEYTVAIIIVIEVVIGLPVCTVVYHHSSYHL